MKDDKTFRMSQGITTFGVGSIIGIGDESFVNTGVTNDHLQYQINFPRLENRLRVNSLRYPKEKSKFGSEPNKFDFMRFPGWMFCKSCRMMTRLTYQMSKDLDGKVPTCENKECKSKRKNVLQPMRFVVACEHGHLDEFPWKYWAHSNQRENIAETGNCQLNKLYFNVRPGVGAGWASLVVSCECKASRSLSDLNGNPDILKSLGVKCSGKQPWEVPNSDSQECGETPRPSQKNASNIYQPVIHSAIDIDISSKAPESNPLDEEIKNHILFDKDLIERVEEDGVDNQIVKVFIKKIAEGVGCEINDVIRLLESSDVAQDEEEESPNNYFEISQSLKEEEYPVFFKNISSKKFINEIEKIDSNTENSKAKILSNLIEHVSLVKRLREVRAFKGFNRLKFDPGKIVYPSLNKKPTWLPAIEVFGEGIFISINHKKIDDWYKKNKAQIDDKFNPLMDRYIEHGNDERFGPFSIKFILLHTLSHILIRQLSFESGYNASALRESIYCSDENQKMAGILIYTADSDSEGSLGGLVRQGQWDRLLPTILLSLEKASWCSSDPVCMESKGQGHNGLNQGACHACALISETSCTHMNSLLSRSLLTDKKIGFFKDIVI